MSNFRLAVFFILLFLSAKIYAQEKVGLVLSGGGAAGLVHIGVIKALEENDIPINCAAGTSMGALVASMYAAGYSPEKMIQVVTSENFINQARGIIDDDYSYYFKRREMNASWINFKFSPDTVITTSLPTNLISPIAIDFGLLEKYTAVSAAANYNFDSLFVPFRCVAADIEGKSQVIFKSGHLNEAVRASMSYPFYLMPVNYYGRLLYDGGIYNNFPADVLENDFKPSFIIGSNVSGNAKAPDEDNIVSQLKSMLLGKTEYEIKCTKHIIISPDVEEVGTFDFENIDEIIQHGYIATMLLMDSIKKSVTGRVSKAELDARRLAFNKKLPEFWIENIYIEGVNKHQAGYVRKLLSITPDKKNKAISIESLKPQYFRLVADEKIKHIYPLAKINSNGKFDLFLRIKKEKKLATEVGGNFSSRPISTGFVGLQYNYLRRQAISLYGNFYFGRLYSSFLAGARMDFANKVPFSAEAIVSGARWDYFKSNLAFFDDAKPSYLISNETHAELNFLFPAYNKGKFKIGAAQNNIKNNYYQSLVFFKADTADRNDFTFSSAHLCYNRNTLNRKQYASAGSYFDVSIKYVYGQEKNYPGNTSNKNEINTIYGYYRKYHQWIQAKITFDDYLKSSGRFRFGVFAEGVYSSQEFFANYTATMLLSPAFQPIPESKTLFLTNFRANQYIAGGLKTLISLPFNLDIRLEGYIFQPYLTIQKSKIGNKAEYSQPFEFRTFMASSAIVYNTPIGPAAFSVNYYDKFENHNSNFSFLFTFGYLLFNKKALD